MTGELERLIKKAKSIQMTTEEKEIQRQSFAYGNAKIENDDITKEFVAEAAKQLAKEIRG